MTTSAWKAKLASRFSPLPLLLRVTVVMLRCYALVAYKYVGNLSRILISCPDCILRASVLRSHDLAI